MQKVTKKSRQTRMAQPVLPANATGAVSQFFSTSLLQPYFRSLPKKGISKFVSVVLQSITIPKWKATKTIVSIYKQILWVSI